MNATKEQVEAVDLSVKGALRVKGSLVAASVLSHRDAVHGLTCSYPPPELLRNTIPDSYVVNKRITAKRKPCS